jgi:hypothetical protein
MRLEQATRWLALAVLATLSLAACAPAQDPEVTLVRSTIERYNTLLAQGYRTTNMTDMYEVATQLQAETEYIHMSSLGEGGVRLLPELKRLEFVRVGVDPTRAAAETLETWDYTHVSIQDGATLMIQRGMVYRLAWDLEKQADGRWLVSDVRAIGATSAVEPSSIATPASGAGP